MTEAAPQVEKGADINLIDSYGESLLVKSLRAKRLDLVPSRGASGLLCNRAKPKQSRVSGTCTWPSFCSAVESLAGTRR